MTADDVKWSLDRTARGQQGYSFIGEASTRVVDPQTVEVTPTQPNLRGRADLASDLCGHEERHRPGGSADVHGPLQVCGVRAGPASGRPAQCGLLGDKARLDKVTYRFFPDANTRQLALQSDEVDLVMDLPREQVATLKSRAGFKVANAPVGRTMLMYL